jgi:hypothetical protein
LFFITNKQAGKIITTVNDTGLQVSHGHWPKHSWEGEVTKHGMTATCEARLLVAGSSSTCISHLAHPLALIGHEPEQRVLMLKIH